MISATYNFLLMPFSFSPPKSLPKSDTAEAGGSASRKVNDAGRRACGSRVVKKFECVRVPMPSHAAPNPLQIEVTGAVGGSWCVYNLGSTLRRGC